MIFEISGLGQNRVRKAADREMKAPREGWAQGWPQEGLSMPGVRVRSQMRKGQRGCVDKLRR